MACSVLCLKGPNGAAEGLGTPVLAEDNVGWRGAKWPATGLIVVPALPFTGVGSGRAADVPVLLSRMDSHNG